MKAPSFAWLLAICLFGSCIRTSIPIPKPPSSGGSPTSPDTTGTPGQTSYSLQWQKTLDGYQINGILQTADGGYAGTGVMNNHAWVFKLDAARNLVWQKQLGRNYNDMGSSIVAVADGGFVVAGSSASDGVGGYPGASDGFVFKVDANGNTVWQHFYGSSADDYFVSIVATSDGGFLLSGAAGKGDGDITDFHGGVSDLWLLKLDAGGNKLSSTTYGGPSEDSYGIVRACQGGGYILAGRTYGAGGEVPGYKGDIDIIVFKLDASLNIVWARNYGGSLPDMNMGLASTPDGGCMVLGETASNDGDVSGNHNTGGGNDAWVLKLDKNGQVQWQKTLGGATNSEDFTSAVATSDGGYMIGGETYSTDGDVTYLHGASDAWLVKLDGTGKLVWQKTFGGSSSDETQCLIPAADGGFISAGFAEARDGDVSGTGGGAWLFEIK